MTTQDTTNIQDCQDLLASIQNLMGQVVETQAEVNAKEVALDAVSNLV